MFFLRLNASASITFGSRGYIHRSLVNIQRSDQSVHDTRIWIQAPPAFFLPQSTLFLPPLLGRLFFNALPPQLPRLWVQPFLFDVWSVTHKLRFMLTMLITVFPQVFHVRLQRGHATPKLANQPDLRKRNHLYHPSSKRNRLQCHELQLLEKPGSRVHGQV